MGEDLIKKLKKELTSNESLEDKEVRLVRFQFYKKSNLLKIIVRACENLSDEDEQLFKNVVLKNIQINVNVEVLCYLDIKGASKEDIISKYWLEVVGDITRKFPLAKEVLSSEHREIINDKRILIKYGSEALIKHLKKKDIEKIISKQIQDLFAVDLP